MRESQGEFQIRAVAVEELEARLGVVGQRHARRPRPLPTAALLAERAAHPLGYLLLAHERHRLGLATLDLGLLEFVFERPSAAARAALLEAAVSVLYAAQLPLVALCGASGAYAGLGLAPCATHAALLLDGVGEPTVAPLRPATADDLDDLAALHAATYAGLALSAVRAAPDWRWLLAEPAAWLVLEESLGRVVAYGRVGVPANPFDGDQQTRETRLVVHEAGVADAGAARLLIRGLASEAKRIGGKLELRLAPAHPVAQGALLLGAQGLLWAPNQAEPTQLWGVVELFGALDALAPELLRRLRNSRYAGWSGAVRLEGEGGVATLRCDEQRVEARAGGGPAAVHVSALGLGAASQLLLGYRAAADLRATGELQCADLDLGLLDVLFPQLGSAM